MFTDHALADPDVQYRREEYDDLYCIRSDNFSAQAARRQPLRSNAVAARGEVLDLGADIMTPGLAAFGALSNGTWREIASILKAMPKFAVNKKQPARPDAVGMDTRSRRG